MKGHERTGLKPGERVVGVDELLSAFGDALTQLHAGVKTLGAVQLLGAIPKQIPNGQSGRLSTSAGRIAGYSLHETSGATALVKLHDGNDAAADLVAVISLVANESPRAWMLPGGIAFSNGLFVNVVSGSIEGVIYLGTTL